VDLQRRLSHHPNVVRFIGACCELPFGVDLGRCLPAAALSARGMKLAIVMELCKLGSVFTMIGQARRVRGCCCSHAVTAAAAAAAAAAEGRCEVHASRARLQVHNLLSTRPIIGRLRVHTVRYIYTMNLSSPVLAHQCPLPAQVRALLEDGTSVVEVKRSLPYGHLMYSDWTVRLEIARGAAAGVEYMHQHGVVHRDLTSYNLLLDDGKPWKVGGRRMVSCGGGAMCWWLGGASVVWEACVGGVVAQASDAIHTSWLVGCCWISRAGSKGGEPAVHGAVHGAVHVLQLVLRRVLLCCWHACACIIPAGHVWTATACSWHGSSLIQASLMLLCSDYAAVHQACTHCDAWHCCRPCHRPSATAPVLTGPLLLLAQVKVCDFNLSRIVSDNNLLINSGNPNSPGWQSPEMLSGRWGLRAAGPCDRAPARVLRCAGS
jgi:serine/threonine protein kinase